MKPLHLPRPVFDAQTRHGISSPQAYAENMVQHVMDCEEWIRAYHDIETEGWGVCQMWVMEHEDGRVARLPEPKRLEQIRAASKRRGEQWIEEKLKFLEENDRI